MTPSINVTVSMPFYDSLSKEKAIEAAGAIIQVLPQSSQLQTQILIKQVSEKSNDISVCNKHLFSYVIGLTGLTSLFVSCIASMLIPAIGSVGIIGIACLLKRKVTVLNSEESTASSDRVHKVFKKDNLSSQSAPIVSALDTAVNLGSILPPAQKNAVNIPPPPPPLPSAQNDVVNMSLPPAQNSIVNTGPLPAPQKHAHSNAQDIRTSSIDDSRAILLASIRERRLSNIYFDLEEIKKNLMDNSQKYPASALLEELRTTYGRGLKICQNRDKKGDHFLLKAWGKYFEDKVKKFEANFGKFELIQSSDMEEICQKTEMISSLLDNMKWAHTLLTILSERMDLTNELRKYCTEKAVHTEGHIVKVQRNEPKKPEEDKDVQQSFFSKKIDVIYKATHGDSSSDNENSNDEEWESS